jgi:hypothetical protein
VFRNASHDKSFLILFLKGITLKTLLKIVMGVIAVLILALIVVRIVGFEPNGTRPGLWLKGNLVTTPVTDWSFTDKYATIEIQTNTWYLIPHSVTATVVCSRGKLYLTSNEPKGVTYPNFRNWHRNIARDPHVRIKVGDNLYDGTVAYLVTDPDEEAAAVQAKINKYPPFGSLERTNRKPAPGTTVVMLRFVSS